MPVLHRGERVGGQKQVTTPLSHGEMTKHWVPNHAKKVLEILGLCLSLTTQYMNISKYKLSVMPLLYSEAGICVVFVVASDKGDQDSAAHPKGRKQPRRVADKDYLEQMSSGTDVLSGCE